MSPANNHSPITTISITEVADLLKCLWADLHPAPPILIIGPPGGGKTSIISQTAATLDMPCEVLMGNTLEPSDVAGIPHLRGDEMVLAPPAWAMRIAGKRAVLNFDEINTARPATLAALLRVILERRVGDVDLGPDVCVVATMNPAEEAAHGWELPPAVANRFLHFAVAPTSVAAWKKWAASQPESPEYHDLATAFPLASLYSEPGSGAFASPRSWHFALKSAAALMRGGAGYADMIQLAVAAAVSPGVAISWYDAMNKSEVSDWSKVDPGRVRLEFDSKFAQLDTPNGVDEFWDFVDAASHHHGPLLYTLIGKHREKLRATVVSQKIKSKSNAILKRIQTSVA